MKHYVTFSFKRKWETARIIKKRLSASIIQNTQSCLDDYTNEFCQQKKLALQKNISLLSKMREDYKSCNE